MKAMILAAGFGTRLKPITDSIPKPLIEVNGEVILERIIRRLSASGFDEIVINVHHLAGKIKNFLKSKNNFGLRIELSEEKEILGTGGALKKAEWFLRNSGHFILHNADIYTNLDYQNLYKCHLRYNSLATLAVKNRDSKSYLLFDENMNLKGISSKKESGYKSLAFSGVHVISAEIFSKMTELGFFSIIDVYMRLIGEGEILKGFCDDKSLWFDIGSIGKLEELNKFLRRRK